MESRRRIGTERKVEGERKKEGERNGQKSWGGKKKTKAEIDRDRRKERGKKEASL